MAFLAGHLGVQAGQWIASSGVIELAGALSETGYFPLVVVMTLQAVLAQAAFVFVFMASYARGRDSEESPIQVLGLDALTFAGGNMFGRMAPVAGQPRVLAFERVTGLAVVKSFDIPLDQGEVHAVVVGVATGALLT